MNDEKAEAYRREWGPVIGIACIALWQTALGRGPVFTVAHLWDLFGTLLGFGVLYYLGLEIVRIASAAEKRWSRVFRIAAGLAVNLLVIWLLNGYFK